MLGQITKANRPPPLPKPKKIAPRPMMIITIIVVTLIIANRTDFTIQAHRTDLRQRDQSDGNQRRRSTAPSPKTRTDADPNGGNFRDPNRHPHKPV